MAYIRCTDETHQKVRIAAASLGITMQDMVERAFNAFLKDDRPERATAARPGEDVAGTHKWHDNLDEILNSGFADTVSACQVALTSMRLLVRHRKLGSSQPSV